MIKITNYELGIIFPLKDEDEANRVACFERPPRKYSSNDEPWVSNTFHDCCPQRHSSQIQDESLYLQEMG